ncbi:hypothetical protein WKW80_08985 [Variovorax humicola]|uniref:Uncharacterized protein n=1 Tax=Variovorax humicola TaxID=1769758 RepID=A0ABU8VWI7_9BURK
MQRSCPMQPAAAFEIRFESLVHGGVAMTFPCDSEGQVDLDAMSERTRNDYFFARGMIGRQYAMPQVVRRELH